PPTTPTTPPAASPNPADEWATGPLPESPPPAPGPTFGHADDEPRGRHPRPPRPADAEDYRPPWRRSAQAVGRPRERTAGERQLVRHGFVGRRGGPPGYSGGRSARVSGRTM